MDKQIIRNSDLSAEQKILAAARQEFCEHGIDGARMQSIADRAGVNKALLHYYFRSKNKLFEIIIGSLVSEIWRTIHADLNAGPQGLDLRSLIRSLVSSYIAVMSKQPEIPRILIRQLLSRDGNVRIIAHGIFEEVGSSANRIMAVFRTDMKAGRIKKVDPVQLIMNIMGMIIATFLSEPIADIVREETGFCIAYDDKFYRARIDFITNMVFDGIAVKERKS